MNPKINTTNVINHLQLVERYIQALSHAITTDILRPDQLVRVQERLDYIEQDIRQRTGAVADGVYGPMVELQALIHIASGKHHLVPVCVAELESLPNEYRVRSTVFAEFAQQSLQTKSPQPQPASPSHHRPSPRKPARSKRKLAFVSVVVLLAVSFTGFVLLTGRLNPVTIAKQYSLSQSLMAQYKDCTNDLLAQKAKIDTSDNKAIESYNQAFADCEAVRAQQNTAADTFHALLAFGDSSLTLPPQ